jgi:hypothetical protein
MKVKRQGGERNSTKSCSEIIVSVWRASGSPAVGASELAQIQNALAEVLRPDELPSPARIARELAQSGASLQHPEIIESDARWRESQIASQIHAFQSLRPLQTGVALQFNQAAALLAELEELRGQFVSAGNEGALADLKTLAIEARQAARNRAKDASLSAADSEVQAEISEWFRVWLETPNLFDQWLELRRSSAAFKAKFSNYD